VTTVIVSGEINDDAAQRDFVRINSIGRLFLSFTERRKMAENMWRILIMAAKVRGAGEDVQK